MKEEIKSQVCDCTVIHSEIISDVNSQMPEYEKLYKLSDLYKNFADGTRVKILWALSLNEMCVCDLAFLFNMTKSAVSHQLKVLRLSDLVKFRKEGKVVYYSLSDEHVKSILAQGFEHVNE